MSKSVNEVKSSQLSSVVGSQATSELSAFDSPEAVLRLQSAAPTLYAALKAFETGFADGSIKWARPRQSDNDPYHPANVSLCAALELVENR